MTSVYFHTLWVATLSLAVLATVGCDTTPSFEEQQRLTEAACAANPACVEAQKQSVLNLQQQAEARAIATAQAVQKKVEEEQNRRETLATMETAIARMRGLGLVTRMDGGARSVPGISRIYIDRHLWDGFKVDQKEDIVKVLSAYRSASEDRPQVTLYDDRSGHELANFGVFSGVQLQ